MTASRRKGTDAESRVVAWLRERGWVHAERRALAGARDRGDVAGLVGVVVEVKAERAWTPGGYLAELAAEVVNDGAEVGVVVVKRRGTTDVGRWYALTDAATFFDLVRRAGY